MDEYTPEFTRALVDTLLREFPPMSARDYDSLASRVAVEGDDAHIVIFDCGEENHRGFDYYVAESLAAATEEIDARYPDIHGYIVNAQNGYRYLITEYVTVAIHPKPFDIITPDEVHGD